MLIMKRWSRDRKGSASLICRAIWGHAKSGMQQAVEVGSWSGVNSSSHAFIDDVIHFSRSLQRAPCSTHTPTSSPHHLPSAHFPPAIVTFRPRGSLQFPTVFFPPPTLASSKFGVSPFSRYPQEAHGAPRTDP